MTAAPLIITPAVTADLVALRDLAGKHPVNMAVLVQALAADGDAGHAAKRAHMAHMGKQTVKIPGPWPFLVTFAIETHHPCGTARHMGMSMSIERPGRVPHPLGVWMVAKILGFTGSWDFEGCVLNKEELLNRGVAVNVIQPIDFREAPPRAM